MSVNADRRDPDRPEARILIVDDEPSIRELLSATLSFAGFEVVTAADGQDALRAASDMRPDLVVLDIMLPDTDGFTVLRQLRSASADLTNVPVVFLTARDAPADKVQGLTVGGDDYVTKPFSLEEVVARIRAVLRRTRPPEPDDGRYVYGDLELDEDAHEVRRAGRPVDLSPTEFKLLRYLMVNAERVVSKAQILDHVWDYDFAGEPAIVESYISYLRRKIDSAENLGLGEDAARDLVPLVHTRRGVGYVLRRPAGR